MESSPLFVVARPIGRRRTNPGAVRAVVELELASTRKRAEAPRRPFECMAISTPRSDRYHLVADITEFDEAAKPVSPRCW